MASIEDVAALRLFVSEPDDSTYTDAALGVVIDASTGLNAAAATVWLQKAASYAELVDISEGGSQRKNSELYKNAIAMTALFQGRADDDASGGGRPRIIKLVRT